MVFGEGTRISPESISTPGSVLYFALVTDGGLLLVTGWTRSSGWSMVSRPGCLAGATDPSGSHRPYQIVESEKILSRMIFQSQLWLLLLLSFWDYGHRVMTLCHQLFCRKIFQHEENEGRRQPVAIWTLHSFQLGIYCQLLAFRETQTATQHHFYPCFISEMIAGRLGRRL